MDHPEHPFIHKLFLFFISILFVNVAILDFLLIKDLKSVFSTTLFSPYQKISSEKTAQLTCPQSCIDQINKVEEFLSGKISSQSLLLQTNPTQQTATQPKQFFITIGSGTGSSDDWQDVPGLQVTIDSSQYGKIKAAYFETSVYIPNANQEVYVRLYNVTDNHPVWYSDLTFNNAGVAQTQTTQPIILENGNKAYKVQMRTQLRASTNINSRIRIDTY